jgi:predicted transcriptional regulator of viral defense system
MRPATPVSQGPARGQQLKLLEALDGLGRDYVDLQVDADLLDSITAQPRKLMHRLKRKGLVSPIQNGRYLVYRDRRPRSASRPRIRSLEPLAVEVLRRLDHEYFLSWHSALWHHRLIEQQSRRLYVAVRGARKRDARIGPWSIHFVAVAPGRFFGGEPVLIAGQEVFVASVERAILDAFDQPRLAGGVAAAPVALRNAYERGRLDPERLVELALAFNRPTLNRRLGFFMERYDVPGHDALRTRLGKGYAVTLAAGTDPEQPDGVDTSWGVRLDHTLLAAADRPK